MATLQKSRTRRLKFRKRSTTTIRILLSNKLPKARCLKCSKQLHGISSATRKQFKKLNRSQKRSQRQHPELCSACSRRAIINAVRLPGVPILSATQEMQENPHQEIPGEDEDA